VDDAAARIDFGSSAHEVDRLVRGCDPQPGAWAEHETRVVRLYGSRLIAREHDAVPGTVLGMGEENRLLVALAAGHALALAKLRVGEGGKVAAGEAGLAPGDRLS
jgi:methionyl-tRNA formyltransferase